MLDIQVKIRVPPSLAKKIDELVGQDGYGESRASVCLALLEPVLSDSELSEIGGEDIPENGIQSDLILQEIQAIRRERISDLESHKRTNLLAGEFGTFRSEITKKISELKQENSESNESLYSDLKREINSIEKPIKSAGILASLLFGILAIFSCLKIYSIEDAKKPLLEQIYRGEKFQNQIAKLVCSSPSGRVEFSPIFVSQLCGYKVK